MKNEQTLLLRARQLDKQVLAEIYDLFSPALYRYCYRLLGSASQAEECVAETFARFLQALYKGKGPTQFLKAYLYRTAHNWVVDQYRRQPPPPLPLESDQIPADPSSPHQTAEEHFEQERIRLALFQLTPGQRQVIMLKFLEDWSNEEIAIAIGKPVPAVKALQHRELEALLRVLLTTDEEGRL